MQKVCEVAESPDVSANGFQKLVNYKIGVIPLPLYLILAVVVFLAAVFEKLPADMLGGFAVIMIMGIFLGHFGLRLPILKDIGGPAILSLLVPSAMVFYHIFNQSSLNAITALMKQANFLYLYISCLVVGSILGMNRTTLIQGFLRMFVPMISAAVVAVIVGSIVGMACGYSLYHTFFFILVPILCGGIGEGILPLTLGYAEILQKAQSLFIAQLIPAVMLGNLTAIICSGLLKKLGERRPELSGNGILVKSGNDQEVMSAKQEEKPVEFALMGAGLLMACSFFIFGGLLSKFIGIPGPIIMILTAALLKTLKIMPARMEQGAYHLYRFISSSLTWPLMVGLGVIYIPWNVLMEAITPAYIAVCVSTVLAVVTTGFFVGKWMKMYPVESAVVTACQSGMGGTGDVAILSASNRIGLMPFAQIATRLGGAGMVVLATLLLKIVH